MSIFGRKPEGEQLQDGSHGDRGHYGIGDVIRILRTLPVEQHAELVVQVIKTTLESVNVRVSDLIDDASKHQQKVSERIAGLQSQIIELTKQIDTHRDEVSGLEASLAETTSAKERLQLAEQAALAAGAHLPAPAIPPVPGHAAPPLAPPPRVPPPKPPEAHHGAKN